MHIRHCQLFFRLSLQGKHSQLLKAVPVDAQHLIVQRTKELMTSSHQGQKLFNPCSLGFSLQMRTCERCKSLLTEQVTQVVMTDA